MNASLDATAQERCDGIHAIVREFATEKRPTIGHFEVVEVGGEMTTHVSVLWDDEVRNLFEIDEFRIAQIFSVLGSEDRLAILRELTKAPKTAAQLVQSLGFRTTGQAYHHLRELQLQGYVAQREGGIFHLDTKMAGIYFAALGLAWNAGVRHEEGK